RLVELGVVADLAVGDRERLAELLGLGHVEVDRRRRRAGRGGGGRGRCRRYWRRRRRGRRAGRRRRSRGEILDAAAELRPDRRRLQLRNVERRRLRRRVVELGRARSRVRVAVTDHLLLDLVDLGLHAGILARGRLGGARL